MIYLLDVNALVALGFGNHEFHSRVVEWLRSHSSLTLATCSITELGFIRVLSQAPAYGLTVNQARTVLLRIKESDAFTFSFLNDNLDVSQLPTWVKTPKQITDGHLVELADANGGTLATLDRGIPGAYRIPQTTMLD